MADQTNRIEIFRGRTGVWIGCSCSLPQALGLERPCVGFCRGANPEAAFHRGNAARYYGIIRHMTLRTVFDEPKTAGDEFQVAYATAH